MEVTGLAQPHSGLLFVGLVENLNNNSCEEKLSWERELPG